MNLNKINSIIIISALILALLPSIISASEPSNKEFAAKVAQTMREIQRHYRYKSTSSTGFINWNSCLCGGVATPPYPPDEFYLYCVNENPETRISLVQDVVEGLEFLLFYGPDFVTEDYWPQNIQQKSDVLLYYDELDDFPGIPDSGDINSTNYWQALNNVYDAVAQKLKFVYIPSRQICSSTNYHAKQRVGYGDGDTCNDAKDNAVADYGENDWSDIYCDPYNYLPDVYVEEWSLDYCEEYHYYCNAMLVGVKFYLEADLQGYDSTNTFQLYHYNRICPYGAGFSNTSNFSETENWQPALDTPELDEYWYSPEYVYEPEFQKSTCPVSDCDESYGESYGWYFREGVVLIECKFPDEVNDIGRDTATLDIFKEHEKGIVYAANDKCDEWWWGETVDGIVKPCQEYLTASKRCVTVNLVESYDLKSATLYIPTSGYPSTGWDAIGTELKDPTEIICYPDFNELRFSVRARKMKSGAEPISIKFVVRFWRQNYPNITYYSENLISLVVKPNQGEICCNEEQCQFITIKTGNIETGEFCLYREDPNVLEHVENGDIEVHLPDRKSEWYIMKFPPCGFTEPWAVEKSDGKIIVTYGYWKKYIFTSNSPYKLTSITDANDNDLAYFDYDAYGRLERQEDATNSDYYILYDYNDLADFNEYPQKIIAQADDVNRIYTIEYDYLGRARAVGAGSCACSGSGAGAVRYAFDDDNFIKEERIYDTNEVIYEYVRDSYGRILEKWIGAKDSNNCMQKTVYYEYSGGAVVDIYDYNDANSYKVTREYRNPAGLVTQLISYDDLNENPNSPEGDSFTENIFYYYDSNDIMVKKVVILPLGDSNDPPDPCTAIRKEYTYDPNTGSMLMEMWFGSNDVNFIVSSYTYDYIKDVNGNILNTRILTSTDARGAVTHYYYDGNDTDPNLKVMPQVSSGISGTQQLKYRYTYDSQNRVILEEQLDGSNGIIAKTKYIYDDFGNLKERHEYIDPVNNDSNEVIQYEHNGYGEMVKMTLPSGVIQGWSYNDRGKTEYEVVYDPCDLNYVYSKTQYFYDNNGRQTKIAKAVFNDKFSINAEPNDTKWVWTEYEYDSRGNRTKIIEDANGLGLETTYEYNHQGEVTKVTLPNGKWTKMVRDGRGLVILQIVGYYDNSLGRDVESARTEYQYDANGNLEWETAPNLIKTKYEYDDFDRLVKVTRGL